MKITYSFTHTVEMDDDSYESMEFEDVLAHEKEYIVDTITTIIEENPDVVEILITSYHP